MTVRIQLQPLGRILEVPRGTPLRSVLFEQGVEFPCGGRGRCKGCRVRLLQGDAPITAEDHERLSPRELDTGWRLACRAVANEDLTLELAQWEAEILSDHTAFHFEPEPGHGIAIDLGTTTLVAQLLDRQTGCVLAVETALNQQAQHGADIMSRVDFAARGGADCLASLIRAQLGEMISALLAEAHLDGHSVHEVVIVGNTVMHHLFSGLDVTPLAQVPFEPQDLGLQSFTASDLAWPAISAATIRFLPCLGGFVGSDILAGILATQLHKSEPLRVLVDLGTNGEMVVGHQHRLLCASTAAGPAFEGARISCGMRATTGAISAVHANAAGLMLEVIGQGTPRGICGSGLVDAVACGLDLQRILPSGRFREAQHLALCPQVALTQGDIRELQLAKGAIAAGLRLLLAQLGARIHDVDQVFLAGAFGNYIRRTSAQRIGLLPFPPERVVPSGNTALLGAKLALFQGPSLQHEIASIQSRITHVPLHQDATFLEVFAEDMAFP